eukprot:6396535-Pyramimonas_sp.AAC.1
MVCDHRGGTTSTTNAIMLQYGIACEDMSAHHSRGQGWVARPSGERRRARGRADLEHEGDPPRLLVVGHHDQIPPPPRQA